jgi:hypothetical protein
MPAHCRDDSGREWAAGVQTLSKQSQPTQRADETKRRIITSQVSSVAGSEQAARAF